MTTPSPTQLAGSVVAVAISADGAALNSAYQIIAVDVWTGVNRLPRARLVISDGDPARATFPISETAALIPGAALVIRLGYGTDTTPVFSGIIQRQGLEISQNGAARLIVEATDKALAMTLARSNAIFTDTTDSAVITKLIEAAGLTANVTATSTSQPAIVQYYASDWDVMMMRAQLNAMVVVVSDGSVTVKPASTGGTPVLALTYGDSILEFQAEMDAATQFSASALQSYAWDPATQKLSTSGSASTAVTTPGNLSSDTLAKVFGINAAPQQTAGTLAAADLTEWSSAELMKSRLAKIRGTVRFQGSALAVPGAMVTLAGLGDRFNGDAYVAGVHHHMSEGLWTTAIEIGLSPDWFSATAHHIMAPPAAGQLPGVANLQTGIILKTDADPDGEFRMQVQLPLLQAGGAGLWARLGSFYASNGIGAEFYPEIGDEVVVAFMDGDPRFPVILGSLYSKKNPPPVTPDTMNNRKSIVTRAKLRVDFFEDLPATEISTPGGQSVRLDDDAKTVTIKDCNGNSITMAAAGITIDSASKITLSAKTDVAITANGKVTVTGTSGVSLAGLTVKAEADTEFEAQGNAGAKLTSPAMVTIQGGLVKIN